MKLHKKIFISGVILSLFALSGIALAEENTTTATGATPTTINVEASKAEKKAKAEALRAEVKAKKEALKAEAKIKREAIKKEKETFALQMAQERFAQAVAEAEAGLLAAQAKLTEAKTAAAAAVDRVSFERARKLFIEARQIFDRAMRPLKKTPKIETSDEAKAPTASIVPAPTTTNTETNQ